MKKWVLIVTLGVCGILSSSVLLGDNRADSGKPEQESTVTEKTIEQVQAAHTEKWMSIPGVEGTGIGLCEGKSCIKIFSSTTAEELEGKIPSVVDGYPVTIEEVGAFHGQD